MTAAPCNWPIASPEIDPEDPQGALCEPCEPLESLDPTQRTRVENMAVELLWSWTGRRYGLCTETVRPCRAECSDRPPTFWGRKPQSGGATSWVPVLLSGKWYNVGCGMCGPDCSCAPDEARTLVLPGTVASIDEIKIGGLTLAESSYELRNGVLYRTDGGAWPICNDEIADPDEVDSPAWTVTYKRGLPVPDGGELAAYTLACELAKALCNDKTCKLPQRVQSITRQGVTMAVLDSFEDIQEGRTGIWTVDAWVAAMSAPRTVQPKVYSPDIEKGRGRGTALGTGYGSTR